MTTPRNTSRVGNSAAGSHNSTRKRSQIPPVVLEDEPLTDCSTDDERIRGVKINKWVIPNGGKKDFLIKTKGGAGGTDNDELLPTILPYARLPQTAHDLAFQLNLSVLTGEQETTASEWAQEKIADCRNLQSHEWQVVFSHIMEDDRGTQYPVIRLRAEAVDLAGEKLSRLEIPEHQRGFREARNNVIRAMGMIPGNIKYHFWFRGSLIGDFCLQQVTGDNSAGAGGGGERYTVPPPKFTVTEIRASTLAEDNQRYLLFESETKIRHGFYGRRPITASWSVDLQLTDFEAHVHNSANATALQAFETVNSGELKANCDKGMRGAFKAFMASFDRAYAHLCGHSKENCQAAASACFKSLRYEWSDSTPTSVLNYIARARPLLSRMSDLGIREASGGPAQIVVGSTIFRDERDKVRKYEALWNHISVNDWTKLRDLDAIYGYLNELVRDRDAWIEYDAEIGKKPARTPDHQQVKNTDDTTFKGDPCRMCTKDQLRAKHNWRECNKQRKYEQKTGRTAGVTDKPRKKKKRPGAVTDQVAGSTATEVPATAGVQDKGAGKGGKRLTAPEHQCSTVNPGADATHNNTHHHLEKKYRREYYNVKPPLGPMKWAKCTSQHCTMNHPVFDATIGSKCGIARALDMCPTHIAWSEKWTPPAETRPCFVSVRQAS